MNKTFAKDIIEGLSADEKHLSSKYFYDDNGSRIFQEIMQMQEYYLTDSEFEILSLQAQQIVEALKFKQSFNIIELGAGDGFKTFKLLEYLVNNDVKFNYIPIDISQEAISLLTQKLSKRLPKLSLKPKVGDYFEILSETSKKDVPSLLLFLGSNIGNYTNKKAIRLLRLMNQNMNADDKLLIGMDLKKNPITIHNAYYDKNGITKRFNLNLLVRINREFDADFKIDDFDFYCHYNPLSGEVKSYIVSLKAQSVYINKLDASFDFKQNELIWTELSQKYSIQDIDALATMTNFSVETNFLDCKHYFTDSLWKKIA